MEYRIYWQIEVENMNIYEKNLSGTDEIFNEVKSICESDKLGNKLEIVKMFSAAQREYKSMNLRRQFEERIGEKYIQDVIILDEKSAIVSYWKTNHPNDGCWYQPIILGNYQNVIYETFDQALIGMVCLKTNNVQASMWINKMLGIDTE